MLQVQSGLAKGRKLFVPKGTKVRPTTARIKQSIFDTLYDFTNVSVLDVFSGSGALGIESLSRGALHCTFIEKDKSVINMLRKNLENCKLTSKSSILNHDYRKALYILKDKNKFYDYVFIDPPFDLYKNIEAKSLIHDFLITLNINGKMIIEYTVELNMESKNMSIITKKYGSNYVSIISRIK